ncbi:MAG: nucleotidyltransferase domain-containing protein [Lachnospiraceae bacterium]|nr:nucleotidyltransferase domain-containing protein [Lachnospiraceae bacterium]
MDVTLRTMTAKRSLKQTGKQHISVKGSKNKNLPLRSLRETESKKPVDCWKICVSEPYRNCTRIHPIQQKKVGFMINSLKDEDNVQRIIIFGSSVTAQCHVGSDVDIFVFLRENKSLNIDVCAFTYDLWTNYTVDEKMFEEISKKGVVVYERNIS